MAVAHVQVWIDPLRPPAATLGVMVGGRPVHLRRVPPGRAVGECDDEHLLAEHEADPRWRAAADVIIGHPGTGLAAVACGPGRWDVGFGVISGAPWPYVSVLHAWRVMGLPLVTATLLVAPGQVARLRLASPESSAA